MYIIVHSNMYDNNTILFIYRVVFDTDQWCMYLQNDI